MSWRTLSRMGLVVAVVLIFCSSLSAAEEGWPSKPITMIIGWSAGGGSDITARLLFPYVERILSAKVVIVNKPGAGGEISFVELAHSKPDGYTWAWTNTPNVVSFPIMRKTNYLLDDFEPCCNVIYDPGVIVVRADSPFKSMKEMLDYASKNPGRLTISNSGLGGDDYIAVRLLEEAADIKVSQVAFEGAGANVPAILGGHVDAGAVNVSEVKPYVESGKMRALAVMDEERSHLLPDVSTFKELDYGVVSGSARGFSAPKGTPMAIIEKMSLAVKEALEDPDFKKKAEEAYQLIKYMGPAEYKRYLYELKETLKRLYEKSPW